MKLDGITFGKPHSLKRWFLYAVLFCGINVAIFLVVNQIDTVHYAMSDDFFMQNLLNGSLGDYYIFFQQTNVVLNALIASLYKTVPTVNWYGVLYFIAVVASVSFTGAVIADKFSPRLGIPVYLATVPIYYGIILLNFTFTTVCYAVLVCSFVCLIYGFFAESRNLKRALYIIGAILLCLSVLIRWEAVYSAAAYAALLIIWLLLRYRKKSLRAVLAILISFGAVGCFFAADQIYYSTDTELSEYIRFNTARSNLEDKAPLNYAAYETAFQDMEWTAGDVDMIANFYIPDDEKFSVDRMEYIFGQTADTRYNKDTNSIISQLQSTFSDYYAYGNICLFVFLVSVWLTNKNIWTRVFSIFIAALPYVFYALFTIIWRAVFRVTYPHFILSILIMLMLINQNKFKGMAEQFKNSNEKTVKPIAFVAAVTAAFAAVGFSNMFLRAKWTYDERMADLNSETQFAQQAFENMALNSDCAFIYTAPFSPLLNVNLCYGIFDTVEKDLLKNSQILGGWTARSPEYNDFKERYSIKNLPDDLLNNDKVLLVSYNDDLTKQYFSQKYGIEIELEEAIPLGHGMTACRVVSNEIS